MSSKKINQRKKILELIRIYGKFKCFQEFEEFKNFKNLTFQEKSKLLNIRDIIDLSTKECLSTDIPSPLLYKLRSPKLLSNVTYFLIVRKYIQEKREEKNPFYKLISDSYDNDDDDDIWGLKSKMYHDDEVVTKDTYKKQVKKIIEDIFIVQNPNMKIYEYGKETENKANIRYNISNWFANEIDLYLKKCKGETFPAFIQGRYTDITFEKYDELVNAIRKDISKMNDGYQNIRLYNVERILNFELIKYICKIIHNKDELLKYWGNLFTDDEKENLRNIKKKIVKKLLRFKSIADPDVRYILIEAIKAINTEEETLNFKKNIEDNYRIFYDISMDYGLYLLENAYSEQEIFKLIELDKEFIEKLYINKPIGYYDDYEFNKDFTEDDFRIVMEVFQESYGRITDRGRYMNKVYCNIAEGFNNNLTNEEISEKYRIDKNVIEIGIDLYLDWFEKIDVESVYDIVKEYFGGAFEDNNVTNKIAQDINNKISLSEIAKNNNIREHIVKIIKYIYTKYKKMVNPEIIIHIMLRGYKNNLEDESYKNVVSKRIERYLSEGMSQKEIIDNLLIKNENNTNDIIDCLSNSSWETYAIADYLSDVRKDIINERFKINEKKYNALINKTVRGYAAIDDKRRQPHKSNNQLSKEYNLSSNTIKEYIESNKPHKSPQK